MIKIDGAMTGVKEITKVMEVLPRSLKKSVLLTALKKAAKPMVAAGKANAPVGHTGRLKKSIAAGTKLTKGQSKYQLRTGTAILYVGARWPTAPHAHLVEFGTIKMAAKPFLRPAYDATQAKVLSAYGPLMWKVLLKKSATLRKKAEKGTLGKVTTRKLLE